MKADTKKIINLLKTAKGQIDGIIRMVEDNRYCIDVSNQLLAVQAVIKRINGEVITEHMQTCVKNALGGDGDNADEHIAELISLFEKLNG